MSRQIETPGPFPVRRPLTESLEHVGAGGDGGPRDQPLAGSRGLAGFLDPTTLTRAIENLKRSGYRPLHVRPEPSESSGDGRAKSRGEPMNAVEENES